MSFFDELKRRNVLRAAGAYVAISWLILQVAETLLPAFGLEDAVLRTILIVLGIGLVPAVVAAWAFELTPAGLVRDAEVDRTSPASRRMDRRLDRVLFVALALAVAYFAIDKFVFDPARDREREAAVADAAAEAALAESATTRADTARSGPSTLAVLPFSAVGGSEESQLFALGVHDDLLTRLAKLGSLRVLSRTSVMKYRDTTINLRDIGEALGADAILEGGVQSAGNRIRINAQLIDAATDEHLWAETYDRELTTAGIFEVQADIAQAIAVSLQATISAPAADSSPIPTQNMAAYRAFHQAMALRDSRHNVVTSPEYRDLLRRALDLDPGFMRPAAELVGSLSFGYFQGEKEEATVSEAEALLARIRQAAPGSAEHLIAQSYYTYYVLKDYDLAHEVITAAQALAPSDLRLLSLKSWIERRQGDFNAKLATHRLQRELDPENPRYLSSIIVTLAQLHRYEEALALGEPLEDMHPMIAWSLARLRVREHGDLLRMADELARLSREMPRMMPTPELASAYVSARHFDRAAELLRSYEEPDNAASASHYGISDARLTWLELYWLTGNEEGLSRLLPQARADFAGNERDDLGPLLGEAFLSVMAGETDAARQTVARWLRESVVDPASRSGSFWFACQILGLADAADDAVACLRAGLREPSFIAPFMDPQFPHYDGIRETPQFREFLADLPVLRVTLRD